MASLVGWPTRIRVQLGSAWTGKTGLNPGESIVLHVADSGSASLTYTESGTLAANDSTNRIKVLVLATDSPSYYLTVYTSDAAVWDTAAAFQLTSSYAPDSAYTFAEMYNWSPQSEIYLSTSDATFVTGSPLNLNPHVFSKFTSWDLLLDIPVIEIIPVTPTASKSVTPSPPPIEIVPVTPFYVGPPPTIATATTASIEIVPVTPTPVKAATPTPPVIEIEPVTPAVYRAFPIDSPPPIEIVPVTPAYAGPEPTPETPTPAVIEIVPVTPTVRKHYYASMSGTYRIFNAAEYRFFRTSDGSVPQEDDTPFATASSLPDEPVDVFGNGTWHVSVAYFNGCLQSGFYPIELGRTYRTLVVSGGAEANPPPASQLVDVKQVSTGVVRIDGLFIPPDAESYEWAVAYTTNGSEPAEDTPDLTQAVSGTRSILSYSLPTQVAGTVVKVRVQIRRNDGTVGSPVWVYSDDSQVRTVTIAAAVASPTSVDWQTGGLVG